MSCAERIKNSGAGGRGTMVYCSNRELIKGGKKRRRGKIIVWEAVGDLCSMERIRGKGDISEGSGQLPPWVNVSEIRAKGHTT